MTSVRRLAAAATVGIAGGLVAAIGVGSRWYSIVDEGRAVDVPGFGTVELQQSTFQAAGTDVAGAAAVLAILALLAAVMVLLSGRLARVVLLGVVIVASLALTVVALTTDARDARAAAPAEITRGTDVAVHAGSGKPITIAGGLVAVAGAAAALPVARRVARVSMPEGAPQS